MAASYCQIDVNDGVESFYCPITGTVIFNDEAGFSYGEPTTPKLVFFIDWVNNIWGPAAGGARDRDYFEKVSEAVAQWFDLDFDAWLAAVRSALPSSCLIMELVEPRRGGGHDGSPILLCFDLDIASTELVDLEQIV